MTRSSRRIETAVRRVRLGNPRSRSDDKDVSFDFSSSMRELCEDIAVRVPELAHIRMDEVAVCITRARRGGRTGLWAKLTPMRFEHGARVGVRRGRRYLVDPLIVDGREKLYILTFRLPRFLDLTYREKLETVFHELYHIGTAFDGDYRRFAGRYHVHSARGAQFDRQAQRLCDLYLSTLPSPMACRFLRHRFPTLLAHHGSVSGMMIPVPKLVPVEPAA